MLKKLLLIVGLLWSASSFAASPAPGYGPSEDKTVTTTDAWQKIDKDGKPVGDPILSRTAPTPPSSYVPVKITRTVTSYDPVGDVALVSGRITVAFDPSVKLSGFGWYGGFGADASIAPPVPGTAYGEEVLTALQQDANPLMASHSVTIDQAAGIAVVEFDWGPDGYIPQSYVSPDKHYNMFGLVFDTVDPAFSASVVGSASNQASMGVNASTYMLCSGPSGGFFCGVTPVPEPEDGTLLLAGLGVMAGMALRGRQGRGGGAQTVDGHGTHAGASLHGSTPGLLG